jgi:hypothetical protein
MRDGVAEERSMKELTAKMLSMVAAAEPNLAEMSESESSKPVLAGGWSRKQVIGHLIDSASNNHQRFVRALMQPSLEFPDYEQVGCVAVQALPDADWLMLVTLWAAYNRYLAHVISHFPESKLDTPCLIGERPAADLAFMVENYVWHLGHHLDQIVAMPLGLKSDSRHPQFTIGQPPR